MLFCLVGLHLVRSLFGWGFCLFVVFFAGLLPLLLFSLNLDMFAVTMGHTFGVNIDSVLFGLTVAFLVVLLSSLLHVLLALVQVFFSGPYVVLLY